MGKLISDVDSEKLLVALEPEAASIFCRKLASSDVSGYKEVDDKPTFETGTKYLIVDAGGGTIDCVAHEIGKDGVMREIFKATGGPWGGTIVDNEFLKLLYKISGSEIIEKFKKQHSSDYVELMQDFEIKKRGGDESIRVTLPYDFIHFAYKGDTIKERIDKFAAMNSNEVKFAGGKLVLKASPVTLLFADALRHINKHVELLMQKPKLKDLKYIFLVGGFADSVRLQTSLKNQCGDRVTCLVPNEASLAVVKGAVAFGHDPSLIRERICKFTYGTGVCRDFIEGVHRPDLKDVIGGEMQCINIFHTWVKKGDTIGYNEVWEGSYSPSTSNQRRMTFGILRSSNRDVEYTDEKNVEKCGSMIVEMPDLTGGKNRSVDLKVTFGGTQIQVSGYDKTSCKHYNAVVDFFSPS